MCVSRRMDEEDMLYTHNRLLLSHEKEVPLVTCINLENIMPSEVSQKDNYSDFMYK